MSRVMGLGCGGLVPLGWDFWSWQSALRGHCMGYVAMSRCIFVITWNSDMLFFSADCASRVPLLIPELHHPDGPGCDIAISSHCAAIRCYIVCIMSPFTTCRLTPSRTERIACCGESTAIDRDCYGDPSRLVLPRMHLPRRPPPSQHILRILPPSLPTTPNGLQLALCHGWSSSSYLVLVM